MIQILGDDYVYIERPSDDKRISETAKTLN